MMEINTDYDEDAVKMEFEAEEFFFRKIYVWSNCETKKLMELYKSYINEVGPEKRFTHKKNMWLEISSKFPNTTPKQCEDRLKTVLKRKKKAIEKVFISDEETNVTTIDTEDCSDNRFEITKNHKIDYESEDNRTSVKQLRVWTSIETNLLMDLYQRLICEVGPQKRLKLKRDMWAEISTYFSNKGPKQCEERYKTVLRTKKRRIIVKSARKRYNHKSEDKDIITNHKDITELTTKENTESAIEDNNELIAEKNISLEATNPRPWGNPDISIHKTLFEIALMKEKSRERRHKDKVEAIKKIHDLLQQFLSSKNNT